MASGDDVDSGSPGSGFKDISNVVEIDAELWGAYGGASGTANRPFNPSVLVQAEMDVSSYDELNYYVGGEGSSTSGGYNGGGDPESGGPSYGGGGGTDIRVGGNATSDRILVAGGGGGQGENEDGTAAAGGAAGLYDSGGDGSGDSGGPAGESPNSYSDPNFGEFQGRNATFSTGGGGGGGFHAGGNGTFGGGGGGASYYDEGLVIGSAGGTPSYSHSNLDGRVLIDFRDGAQSDFSISTTDIVAGDTVDFTDESTEGYYSIDSRDWGLDVTTDTGSTATATYNEPGDYNITLTVTDSQGYSDTSGQTLNVAAGANVDFTVPSDLVQGFDVTFTDDTTLADGEFKDSESWYVDGNFVSNNEDLNYNFDSPGDITVEKRVEVNGVEYSKTTVVTVEDAATVDFSYDTPVVEGIEQTFTDQTSVVSGASRTNEQWVVDGVLVGSDQDLNYVFDDFGDFSVGKTVTVNGYDYSKGETVTVEQNTTAKFVYSPSDPLEGEQIQFTDESVTPYTITSYSWDFDDGTTSTQQNPTHTYSDIGEYNVSLTVEDDQGQTGTIVKIVEVFSERPTVETDAASNIGDFSATLNGTIADPGLESNADVYFEYREVGASTWNSAPKQTISETGTYSEDLSGLNIETDYEYRAVGENGRGTFTASTVTFSTDENTAPAPGSLTVTPDPIERSVSHDVSFSGSDEAGIDEALIEWVYDGTVQTSQTFTYSSSNSVSDTATDIYTPTQFGNHEIRLTLTDSKGLTSTVSIIKNISADEPVINLQAPSDNATLAYSETYDYLFEISTGNAAITSGSLIVLDSNDNTVQTESVGSISTDTTQIFTFTGQQGEAPGTYAWVVEVNYEESNLTNTPERSLIVTEPSEVSVETGLLIGGGYGLSGYGEEGYGESLDEKGFNYFNAEGGLIFTGDSDFLDLYFQYRKKGETAWKETSREEYDKTGGS